MDTDTVSVILNSLDTLSRDPNIGRPMPNGLLELVISRGRTGYRRSCWEFGISARTITIADRREAGQGQPGNRSTKRLRLQH